jgi:creatinine amidohydrolase
MEIGGTISLREETFVSLVMDIVGSLANDGFKRIVLVNGHGGNTAALGLAAGRCHRELGVPLVVPLYGYSLIAGAAMETLGPEAIGHGGGDEASAVLAVRPDLVRSELLHLPEVDPMLRQTQQILRAAGGSLPIMQQYVSDTGVTGDSRLATTDAGNTIVGRAAAQLQAIVEHLLAIDLPKPPSSHPR